MTLTTQRISTMDALYPDTKISHGNDLPQG